MVKSDHNESPTIAVFGLGYVGCVTAACLANLGYPVVGIDRDSSKVLAVLSGRSPFYEPGLSELIADAVQKGNLDATESAPDGVAAADIAFVCVGTPSERNGNLNLEQLRRVIADISTALATRSRSLIVAIRSTVFPGTCEDVVIPAFDHCRAVSVVSNPEFLREGVAVKDFFDPSLVVVGGDDEVAVNRVAEIYSSLDVHPCLVSLRTAEMIKYACNAFHALKIAFANEIGGLSDRLGIDGREVMETLCRDEKLNVSPAYLKPGFAFGGSCLPKDLRALVYRAKSLDFGAPLLQSILPSNTEHLHRGIQLMLDRRETNIGIVGLAFKENTDDLRESPVVSLIEHLIGKGRTIRIFDPHICLDNIFGTNRTFILNAIPHIGKLMLPSLDALLEWSDCIVIAQNVSAAVRQSIHHTSLPVVNLVEGQSETKSFAYAGT
jgi:GDP-mannose 6-dehydrogenase